MPSTIKALGIQRWAWQKKSLLLRNWHSHRGITRKKRKEGRKGGREGGQEEWRKETLGVKAKQLIFIQWGKRELLSSPNGLSSQGKPPLLPAWSCCLQQLPPVSPQPISLIPTPPSPLLVSETRSLHSASISTQAANAGWWPEGSPLPLSEFKLKMHTWHSVKIPNRMKKEDKGWNERDSLCPEHCFPMQMCQRFVGIRSHWLGLHQP